MRWTNADPLQVVYGTTLGAGAVKTRKWRAESEGATAAGITFSLLLSECLQDLDLLCF